MAPVLRRPSEKRQRPLKSREKPRTKFAESALPESERAAEIKRLEDESRMTVNCGNDYWYSFSRPTRSLSPWKL